MEILLIGIVLFCVGSSIWAAVKLLAWIFRSAMGTGQVDDAPRCPRCGNASLEDGRCRLCGWMRLEPKPVQPGEDEWRITARRVSQLCELGLLDVQTFNSIIVAINQVKGPDTAAASRVAPKPAKVQTVRAVESSASIPPVAPPPLPLVLKEVAPAQAMRVEPPVPQPVAPKRVVPVEAKPKPPRKSVAELLGAFMEESNIRWGELIGGLLIVGCSIALVFTFWGWIEARPWFKFFLFTGATAGV
ncbi:MAG: hypothetical protein ACM359_15030, partial [Bacillota bacterium]